MNTFVRRELRVLTPQEQSSVNQMFKYMAVLLAKEASCVLSRNKFVDATICELQEAVPDELTLLTAWGAWIKSKDDEGTLREVMWPVSQFQTALTGALVIAEEQVAHFRRWGKGRFGGEVVDAASKVLGGAR